MLYYYYYYIIKTVYEPISKLWWPIFNAKCDTMEYMLFFGKQIYQPQGALNNQAFRQETGMKGTVLVGLHSVTVGNINFRIKAGCTVD